MSLFVGAFEWLISPANWQGSSGVPTRLGQHLAVTLLVIAIAGAIALPLGVAVGHTRRGSALVMGIAGAARAVPTLGVLTLAGLILGIGLDAPILALVVLAIPSMLAATYSGFEAVPRQVVSAAKAIGMTPLQRVLRVEIPLAMPVILGGIRAATLQVIATATLAAYTADAGLGRYLFVGLKSRDYEQMLGGALLVTGLALISELALGSLQRLSISTYASPSSRREREGTRSTTHESIP